MGQKAVPGLKAAASSEEGGIRALAIGTLAEIHPADDGTVLRLIIAALKDSDKQVRANASRAFQFYADQSAIIVPALLPLVEDKEAGFVSRRSRG